MEQAGKNINLSSVHDDHDNKMEGQDGIIMGCRETSIDKIAEYNNNNNNSFISCFGELPCYNTTSICPSFLLNKLCSKNKRQYENDELRGDRRYKRMMKNRESAARSRARRQAYTNELELEVAQLTQENAKLRKEQEKLTLFGPVEATSKKGTLCRSLTAPF